MQQTQINPFMIALIIVASLIVGLTAEPFSVNCLKQLCKKEQSLFLAQDTQQAELDCIENSKEMTSVLQNASEQYEQQLLSFPKLIKSFQKQKQYIIIFSYYYRSNSIILQKYFTKCQLSSIEKANLILEYITACYDEILELYDLIIRVGKNQAESNCQQEVLSYCLKQIQFYADINLANERVVSCKNSKQINIDEHSQDLELLYFLYDNIPN